MDVGSPGARDRSRLRSPLRGPLPPSDDYIGKLAAPAASRCDGEGAHHRMPADLIIGRPSLAALVAHADDEVLIAGGTLALAAAAGTPTGVVSLTRGERGPVAAGSL